VLFIFNNSDTLSHCGSLVTIANGRLMSTRALTLPLLAVTAIPNVIELDTMQESAKFARHSKRRRVTPDDVNMALRLRNLEVREKLGAPHSPATVPHHLPQLCPPV
jgi:hypothetical protein